MIFLCVSQSSTRFWNFASKTFCCFNPLPDDFIGVLDRLFARLAIGHAAGQFRNLNQERFVLLAPINDHLVFGFSHSILLPTDTSKSYHEPAQLGSSLLAGLWAEY